MGKRLTSRMKLLGVAMALSTVAGIAIAQQPYFRFGHTGGSLPATPPAEIDLVPPEVPANEGDLDFGSGSTVPFTLRALVGEPVSLEFGTIGGTNPVTWLAGPALPPGLAYSDGVISGTPQAPDKRASNFGAIDATGRQARAAVTFDIYNALVSFSQFKPVIRVGSPYSGTISSNVRSASYALSGAPGAEAIGPDGVSRSALGGTATTVGTFPLSVSVTRAGTQVFAQATREVTVAPPLAIAFSPPTIPPLVGPVAVTVSALNLVGTGQPTIVGSQSRIQSRGLSYSNGILSGNLRSGAATDLTVRIVDSADGASRTATLAIPEIVPSPASIVIGSSRPGDPVVASTGSTTPATIQTEIVDPVCTVTQPVAGITVSADCFISGSPTDPGDYTLGVSIIPGANPQAPPVQVEAPFTVLPALVAGTTTPIANPAPGGPASLVVDTSGVVGTPTFDLIGVTPAQLADAGLSFDPTTGTIQGTVDPDVSLSPQVQLTDSADGKTSLVAFTIVTGAATVTTDVVSANYRSGETRTFAATTNLTNAVFSLVGAPDSVSIDPATGAITIVAPNVSTPNPIGGFAVRASSPTRPTVFRQATVAAVGTVRPALGVSIVATASARTGVAFDLPMTLTNFTTPSVALVGIEPPGLSGTSTGITGKATADGDYTFTLRVTDSVDGKRVDTPIAISVVLGPNFTLASAASPVGKGTIGLPMQVTATPSGQIGAVSFSNVAIPGRTALLSSLGLSISTDGVISGSPSAGSNGIVNVRMTEAGTGTIVDKPLQLAISAAASTSETAPNVYSAIASGLFSLFYDADTDTSANVSSSNRVIFEFPEDVTINGLIANTSNAATLIDRDTGNVYTASGTNGNNRFLASGAQVTGRNFEVYFAGSINVTTLRLTNAGQAIVAPSVTLSATLTDGNSAALNANMNLAVGTALNATAPVTWNLSANLPAGLNFDTASGTITGTTGEYGDIPLTVSVTDARGLTSHPKNTVLRLRSSDHVGLYAPVLSGLGTEEENRDILGAWLDNQDTTASTVRVGQEIILTYDRPVTADRLDVSGTGSGRFKLESVDTGEVIFTNATGGSTTSDFTPRTSKVWRVTVSNQTSGIRFLSLQFGGANPSYVGSPYFVKSTTLRPRINVDVGATLTPSGINAGAGGGTTSQLTWHYTGTLPENLSFNPATGAITGTPTKLERQIIKVYSTNIQGVRSFPGTYDLEVVPPTLVSSVMPLSVEGVSLTGADALAAAYDTDVTAKSRFTLAAGAKAIIRYAAPARTDGFFYSGAANAALEVTNEDWGQVLFAGTAVTNSFTSFGGSNNVSGGKTFGIRNTSAAPITIHSLAMSWGSSYQKMPSIVDRTQTFTRNTSSTMTLATVNGTNPLSYQILSGSLPPGLNPPTATGVISGTPTVAGTYAMTFTVTDGRGYTALPANLTITVQ